VKVLALSRVDPEMRANRDMPGENRDFSTCFRSSERRG
jgi:hypothetical protein